MDLPVNATAVTLSLVILLSYAAGRVLKAHHLVIWGTVLVGGGDPTVGRGGSEQHRPGDRGGGMMVNGVFDHLLFVRTFGAPAGLEGKNDNARA